MSHEVRISVNELLADAPAFHEDANGAPISWGLPENVLRFIDRSVTERSRTLETGAGLSTVIFAAAGAEHVCVVPDAGQVARIRHYCAERRIATDRVQFHIAPSETVLPMLAISCLDLVLIDGRHGFPTPFIDWYYAAMALKVGGLMIVDDTQLWTGDTLRKFLAEEPDWTLEREFAKTVVFRKLADGGHAREWNQQRFVARRSGQT